MQPRISSKDAQGMIDAYAKVYAPKEEPKTETEAPADDGNEFDAEGNLVDLETQEGGND